MHNQQTTTNASNSQKYQQKKKKMNRSKQNECTLYFVKIVLCILCSDFKRKKKI